MILNSHLEVRFLAHLYECTGRALHYPGISVASGGSSSVSKKVEILHLRISVCLPDLKDLGSSSVSKKVEILHLRISVCLPDLKDLGSSSVSKKVKVLHIGTFCTSA